MVHKVGTHLGGIRTLDDLRGRCYVDHEEHWHLRSANGRPMPKAKTMRVWLTGAGSESARQVMHLLAHGAKVAPGHVVVAMCGHHDCINPAHNAVHTRAAAVQVAAAQGRLRTERKAEANRAAGAARSRLTPELRQWLIESTQSGLAVAHALGVSVSWAIAARRRAKEEQMKQKKDPRSMDLPKAMRLIKSVPPRPVYTPPSVKPVVLPSTSYDPRYQCAPGERPWGAGFASAGIGRDVRTGRAWSESA